MNLTPEYITMVINSTIRMTTPILYVTLAAAICSKVRVFNIGLEGTMLTSAFFGILINYYTRNIVLAVIGAGLVGCLISFILGFFIIEFDAFPVVVGMGINTLAGGFTIFLLSMIFHTKGVFSDPTMQGLPKITLPIINKIPYLSTIFSSLTLLDYLVFVIAILLYIFLYKTPIGFRLRAIGINPTAAASLGTNVKRYQILAVTASGFLIGMGGCLLSLGAVTLFVQNITSGRGYIALAANNLGKSHPIGAILSSALFGICQALSGVLQNTSIKQQITAMIPYAATILAMAIFNYSTIKKKKGGK